MEAADVDRGGQQEGGGDKESTQVEQEGRQGEKEVPVKVQVLSQGKGKGNAFVRSSSVRSMAQAMEENRVKGVMGNTDFRMETKEGKLVFTCNICEYEAEHAKAVKSHISKKHREKATADGDVELKKQKDDNEISFSMDRLNKWLVDEDDEGNDQEMNENADDPNKTNVNTNEMTLETARDNVHHLKEENLDLKARIEYLMKDVETKDELADMQQGKINSLEIEKINKDAETDAKTIKFEKAFVLMEKKIENLSQTKENTAVLNELKNGLKNKTKSLEAAELRIAELVKDLGAESNSRSKSEADVVRLESMVERLEKMLEYERKKELAPTTRAGSREEGWQQQAMGPEGWRRQDEGWKQKARGPEGWRRQDEGWQQHARVPEGWRRQVEGWEEESSVSGSRKEVCRDLERPGGCHYGQGCKFYHPPGRGGEVEVKTNDCVFWMEGSCKFSNEHCKGKHDAAKFKTKMKEPRQNQSDFVQTLVKAAVSQALAGVSGTGLAQGGLGATSGGGQQNLGHQQAPIQQQLQVQQTQAPMQYMFQPPGMMMVPHQPQVMMQQPNIGGQQVAWGGQGGLLGAPGARSNQH